MFARHTAAVAMEISKTSCKTTSTKSHWSWIYATTIVAIFTHSCKWHDMAPSCITNKPVISSEYKKQWIAKNSVLFFNWNKYRRPGSVHGVYDCEE